MTWSYSGDPSTSELDEYRFLIGDTNPSEPLLQNEEITYVLNITTSFNLRMYKLYNAIVDNLARAIKRSLGPQMEDPTERTKFFQEKLDYYRKLASVSSGLSLPKYTCPIFTKGMNDNVQFP